MAESKKRVTQVLMIVFLFLVVVGFTIPGFLNFGENNNKLVEPRICQSDADCYLMCGEDQNEPVAVPCSQNLCLKNDCGEHSFYLYQSEPITFQLTVANLSLEKLSNPSNVYVVFKDNQVKVFTGGFSLAQILERINFDFNKKVMNVSINGEVSAYYPSYVPEEGDKIILTY